MKRTPFSQAKSLAVKTAASHKKLHELLKEALKKLKKIRDYEEKWELLLIMIRLAQAYDIGQYRFITKHNFILIISAIAYFVAPIDWIPDNWEGGYIDDAAVITTIGNAVMDDLEAFLAWETAPAAEKYRLTHPPKKRKKTTS